MVGIIIFKILGFVLIGFCILSIIYGLKLKNTGKIGTGLLLMIGMIVIILSYLVFYQITFHV